MNSIIELLRNEPWIKIQQHHELAEWFGFESRNKYRIENSQGQLIGYAAEQQKGVLGFLFRQFLGHWRNFEILIFDQNRQIVAKVLHPFRFIFQRLEIWSSPEYDVGERVGTIQQRFGIFTKCFDVLNAKGQILMTVASPIWKFWTFPFKKENQEVAFVRKKWSGLFSEVFTDRDCFQIEFADSSLTDEERLLLLAAGLFIDLQYFERKASR